MDIKQAQKIIREVFENPFEKERYTNFINNLLNKMEPASFTNQGNYIPDAYKPYISSLERIGKYNDGEHNTDILIVRLKKETSLERARTMQRNFIARYLNGSRGGNLKDAALVAFVSPDKDDWRFSLVKMDYRFEEGKNGKVKVKEEFTPARRWSFLVGGNEASHTAQSQLVSILADDEHNPVLEQLEEAFNIETVTKEFFIEYRNLFIRIKEAMDKVIKNDARIKKDFSAKGVDTVNFTKKLLGQIVFLYFLQKKGWFGVQRDEEWGIGSKQFLRDLFQGEHGTYKNFFNDILEPLFYEALRIDRRHDDDYYSRFNCKIPFLNGGLFDPIGNYDWVHTDIIIPNELFSNDIKTKNGDTGNGILDIFDRYNFTVKEDEPLEKDVAIDPELLGKAYEKFNAIRPDNFDEYKAALQSGQKGAESKFNKKFGVYYTPREIVHYMCQQSLINYLATELEGKVKKEEIETLVHFGEQVGENEVAYLAREQNINEGKQKSTTYISKLPDSIRQNAALIDTALANITVCDPAVGSGAFPVGMMHEIVKIRNLLNDVYIKDKNKTVYDFKRECIENSLYGVDIDPGAVEIAKLRLWLSMIVDENDIRQIKPLPNLDYKIIRGNSLLSVQIDLFNEGLFSELEKLKPLHLNETNPTKKLEYQKKIDELISKITNGHTEFDFEVYFSEVFHEKKGFDVIIANPPYIFSRENLSTSEKSVYKKLYSLTQFKINLYILFIERSYHLMNKKGCFAFIIPNNWLTLSTNSDLRYFILNNAYNIKLVLNYDAVFESASVDTCILIFKKTGDAIIEGYCWTEKELLKVSSQSTNSYLGNNGYIISLTNKKRGTSSDICEKIISQSKPLSFHAEVRNGVQAYTVGEGNPIQTNNMKINRVYHSDIKNGEDWIKYLDGVDVGRYHYGWSGQFIKYGKNLSRQRKPELFIGERLLVRQIPSKPPYCINCCYTNEYAINDNNSMIIKVKNCEIGLKYIQGLLNSRLISFWFIHSFGKLQRKTFPQFKVKELRTFPIKTTSLSYQKQIINFANKIITIMRDEDYVSNTNKQSKVYHYEKQIDQLVYKLYGLTEQEIEIVEQGG